MKQDRLNFSDPPVDHGKRQAELYNNIWAQDSDYGTYIGDVVDTVQHRIAPHMSRIERETHLPLVSVIDFGAGDGRFLGVLRNCRRRVRKTAGVDVYRPASLIAEYGWYKQAMWEPVPERFDYAISTDALEHLPPCKVLETLENIRDCAKHGFLRISLTEDRYGTAHGLHLHESVFPSGTWLAYCHQALIDVTSYRVYLGESQKERALEVWF